MIRRTTCHGFAPSTSAASFTSCGTPSRPRRRGPSRTRCRARCSRRRSPGMPRSGARPRAGAPSRPVSRFTVLSGDDESIAAHAKAATGLRDDERQQHGGAPRALESDVRARQQQRRDQSEHELTDDRRPEHELDRALSRVSELRVVSQPSVVARIRPTAGGAPRAP